MPEAGTNSFILRAILQQPSSFPDAAPEQTMKMKILPWVNWVSHAWLRILFVVVRWKLCSKTVFPFSAVLAGLGEKLCLDAQ